MPQYAVFMTDEGRMDAIPYPVCDDPDTIHILVAAKKGVPYDKSDLTGWRVVVAHNIKEALEWSKGDKNAAALLAHAADEEDRQAAMNPRPRLKARYEAYAGRTVLVPA